MEIIKKVRRLCLCCMEEHEVQIVRVKQKTVFKNVPVEYYAEYEYCDKADEYHAVDEMISNNDISMKNAYRIKMNLLTTNEIVAIREKLGISQTDLSNMLGWGGKTLTRYEGHQVQDMAHDSILRKLDGDPEWFLSMLEERKDKFSESAYKKYRCVAVALFEKNRDRYLRKLIKSQYVSFYNDLNLSGGKILDIDKLIDVICYFCNSENVKNLYKVKLMKLLWYADNLSYKRRKSSITGLVYEALPMGAVPKAHQFLIELNGVMYDEIEFGDSVGYQFKKNPKRVFEYLTEEDKEILDEIIRVLGPYSREEIVARMHSEQAYINTKPGDVIDYKFALELSID